MQRQAAIALVVIAITTVGVMGGDSVIHVQGHWQNSRPTETKKPMMQPFEAYVDDSAYYFVVQNAADRSFVGTHDGQDYFWAQYLFPLDKADEIRGSDTNWMGGAEIGPGSFPSRSTDALQTLWLAYFWHADPTALPAGKCQLQFGRMGLDGDYSAPYDQFTVKLDVKGAPGKRSPFMASFYAPGQGPSRRLKTGYSLDAPYNDGWLFSEFEVLEWTNLLGRSIPIHFIFTDFHPKDSKRFKPPGQHRDDVVPVNRSEYWVTNCSVAQTMPGLFPPVWRGKLISVKDYRKDLNRPVTYSIGARNPSMQGSGLFVSRSSPKFKLLMRGMTGGELETPGMKRLTVIAFSVLSAAVVIFAIVKLRRAKSP